MKENKSVLSIAFKSSIAFFLASLISKGMAYITTPFFTRLLSTEEYGVVAVYFSWLHILGIPAMFCLSYGVFNNGMVEYSDKRDEYSFSMLTLSNLITISFSTILLTIYPFISRYLNIDFTLVVLMCIIFFFQPAYNFWLSRQRYEYKYKSTFIVTTLSGIIAPICSILAIKIFPNDKIQSRIFGMEIPLLLIYIFFYYYIAKNNSFKINTSFWRKAFLFNLPLIPHYLSSLLLGNLDRLMITSIIGKSETAYYTVAYSVASVVLIVWESVNASLIPYTYEKCKQAQYESVSSITNVLLLFFAGGCLFLVLLAPEVVKIMAPESYREAIYVIPPVVGGVFFQAQYYIYSNIVYYYNNPKYVMYASVTATIANFILNYIFIRRFGYFAAGYTTLASYIIQVLIDYVAYKRVSPNRIYNMKYISTLSVIVIAISLLSNLLYDNIFIRYSIFVVLLILTVIFRKKLTQVLNKVLEIRK